MSLNGWMLSTQRRLPTKTCFMVNHLLLSPQYAIMRRSLITTSGFVPRSLMWTLVANYPFTGLPKTRLQGLIEFSVKSWSFNTDTRRVSGFRTQGPGTTLPWQPGPHFITYIYNVWRFVFNMRICWDRDIEVQD